VNPTTRRGLLIGFREIVAGLFLLAISVSCQTIVVNQSTGSGTKLENIDWRVIGLAQPFPESPGGYDMFFRLRSDGRKMSAFDGCNGIWGNYRITDQQVQFVNLGRTEWTCSNAPEHRDVFMKLLASSSRWSLIGEGLELYNTRDQLLVRFERSSE
jgi:heat shock protein HslJ